MNFGIWKHRKREHVMNTFSQYTLLLDLLIYSLSLLKMWILLKHRNMEYESIEKGNHETIVYNCGLYSTHNKLFGICRWIIFCFETNAQHCEIYSQNNSFLRGFVFPCDHLIHISTRELFLQ